MKSNAGILPASRPNVHNLAEASSLGAGRPQDSRQDPGVTLDVWL
ncbi:MAG TPA: hypothetical protein VLI65_06130 [Pyrinomonadaceae bacterium]|nr:hypothetical protein [Pyrinomonadaceae bacterium]